MLNYANLNDVEFEYLCQDIMQKKLDTELHRFAKGKDGGIDLADDVHSRNIIVQVKHYYDFFCFEAHINTKRRSG